MMVTVDFRASAMVRGKTLAGPRSFLGVRWLWEAPQEAGRLWPMLFIRDVRKFAKAPRGREKRVKRSSHADRRKNSAERGKQFVERGKIF